MSIKQEILKNINEELTTEPLTPKEEDSGIEGMRLFTFKTEKAEYGVTFKKDPNENAYDVIFGSFDENGVLDISETNFGEAPVVFSTVNKIVEDFISSVKPNVLDFVAVGASPSRLSIYKRFAKRIANNFPEYEARTVYDLQTKQKKERKIAIVKKKWLEQNKDRQVKESVKNILKEEEKDLQKRITIKLKEGDKILMGKYRNKEAEIKGFSTDSHNQPVVHTNKGKRKLTAFRLMNKMPEQSSQQKYSEFLKKKLKEFGKSSFKKLSTKEKQELSKEWKDNK